MHSFTTVDYLVTNVPKLRKVCILDSNGFVGAENYTEYVPSFENDNRFRAIAESWCIIGLMVVISGFSQSMSQCQ